MPRNDDDILLDTSGLDKISDSGVQEPTSPHGSTTGEHVDDEPRRGPTSNSGSDPGGGQEQQQDSSPTGEQRDSKSFSGDALLGVSGGSASGRAHVDPKLDPSRATDVRGDLNRHTLERETAFDRGANIPAGQSLDTGLGGLTNVDGTKLSTGPNHFGVGNDPLLHGGDAHSPLNVSRDPLATTTSTTAKPGGEKSSSARGNNMGGETRVVAGEMGGAGEKGGGSGFTGGGVRHAPPSGQETSSSTNPTGNMNLVGQSAGGGMKLKDGDKDPPKIYRDLPPATEPPKSNLPEFGKVEEKGLLDKVADGASAAAASVKDGVNAILNFGKKEVNPDDNSGTATGAPTQEQIQNVVAHRGDATHTMDGVAAGPQVEGGPPPDGNRYPLVTDPTGESSSVGTTSTTPTFHNPSSPDVVPGRDGLGSLPPAGGTPGQEGHASELVGTSAAEPGSSDSQGISLVGSDGASSGIHSIDVTAAGDAGGDQTTTQTTVDAGDHAVHTFATEFLAEAPDSVGIIIPDTDHGVDAFAPLEPTEHVSFMDQSSDTADDAPPTDLFGNDDAISG